MARNGDILDRMHKTGVIVVVRLTDPSGYCELAGELGAIGLDAHEITLTTPGALQCIENLRARHPRLLVGAGTVLTIDDARAALSAGAQFVVSPTLDERVLAAAREAAAIGIPGAMTPTEVYRACRAGADAVKIFPAFVGGPDYIKALRGPLPNVRLVPTGGVTVETAPDYLRAGAFTVCLGTSFLSSRHLAEQDFEEPLKKASHLVAQLNTMALAANPRRSDA